MFKKNIDLVVLQIKIVSADFFDLNKVLWCVTNLKMPITDTQKNILDANLYLTHESQLISLIKLTTY